MMKCKCRSIAVLISAICAGSTLAVADGPQRLPERLAGLINDYTPASVNGGPYEMRGEWSLKVHRGRNTATFSAVMNMETSDWGISTGMVNPDDPSSRSPHTHHITMTDAVITLDTSVCPANSPATSGGFVVTGIGHVTGNGTPAPFESNGNPPSTLQICVTGGSAVELSNFTLAFVGLATGHFGPQGIHGVVTCTWPSPGRKPERCSDEAIH